MGFVFKQYREDKCKICLRSYKCDKTEQEIILCVQCAYYKGPGDEELLSEEEQRELKSRIPLV